jgi:Family of unknown function (DUF5681)
MSNRPRIRANSSNYRKPPAEHQFKKGTSGNPSGRPRKKAVQPGGGLGGGITDRLAAMALDEAMRPVTVREGDKVSEIPAMQALFRTMFRAAAQGDTKAGRQLLEVINQAESGRTGTALEILEHAIRYKEAYGPIFEKHEREGLPPPDVFPHPDDMIIDATTGEVTIDGPTSKEQAGAQQAIRDQAISAMPRYFEVEAALKRQPKNSALRLEFKELKKYFRFLQKDSERKLRHEALRQSRLALQPKSAEPEEGDAAASNVIEKDTPRA